MQQSFFLEYLESVKAEFQRYKNLGAQSIAALSEVELNTDTNGANSIAVIVKHLHGNMKSRWSNVFTEDGEKPDRNRDHEFESEALTKEHILEIYHDGWRYLESALASMTEQDFDRPVIIRKESLTLVQAINRQLTHYGYHVGQIVLLAKQFKGPEWVSLSIPKRKSGDHDRGTYLKR